ncbi:mechanosensitive ion channel family protein [Rubrivirga sp. IMCC45206]|uniref:mechanosensitive ion channel family protein n=1 Tax=Rubrivirga sp. IMCC45206 TaxID=3391614 RepID=UPI00398FEAA0
MQIVPRPSAPDTAATAAADTVRPGLTVDDVRAASEAIATPDFWLGIGQTVLEVAVAIGLALFVIWVLSRLKTRWVASVIDDPATDKRRQRVLTTADLLGSVARYVVWAITIVTVLAIIGFDIRALLAGAGIAGLAIGFGAQTLVKDVISGFFLLFDDTLGNGDLIRIGTDTGTVEYVGLRLIKVRKFDGELLMVPAGELRTFGNKSVGYARAIVEVGLSYEQDASVALGVLEEVAAEWAATEEAQAVMVEEAPQVQAILALGDSAVTARIIVQVRPGEQFPAERALRQRIKARFDERGIEIPFPRRTVYVKPLDGGSASDAADALGGD